MDILIIGGTSFVGRHLVEEAVNRGHQVTLFNRGRSNPGLFAELPRITGDRRKDAGKIAGRKWDAVIDSSAYSPADLEPVLSAIDTDHYTFISTVSVYDDFSKGAVAETGSLHEPHTESDEVTGATYGPLKVSCEQLIHQQEGLKSLILRPGIVVGPHDPTDRFTYWVDRLSNAERVLIPGGKDRKVQWIDARDLAGFALSQIEQKGTGTFNVTADPLSMSEFVEAVKTAEADARWFTDEQLTKRGIKPFELPFWIPVSEQHPEGFIVVDNAAAKEHGLQLRTASKSALAVKEWLAAKDPAPLKAGISKEEEQRLIAELE